MPGVRLVIEWTLAPLVLSFNGNYLLDSTAHHSSNGRTISVSNKLRNSASQQTLTHEGVKVAAQKMMWGAQAHQRASAYCQDNPNAKAPSEDWLFFSVVSFELILHSIEQSLRLMLLIHYSTLRPRHNIFALYNKMSNKSGDLPHNLDPGQELKQGIAYLFPNVSHHRRALWGKVF